MMLLYAVNLAWHSYRLDSQSHSISPRVNRQGAGCVRTHPFYIWSDKSQIQDEY
jgi:hypothetical protein